MEIEKELTNEKEASGFENLLLKPKKLSPKIIDFIRWKIVDVIRLFKNGIGFEEYGLTIFCGRQGGGKTMAMTEYLERMKKKFPDLIIVSNYGYKGQDKDMESWHDLVEIRNGTKGVIFAIDEIQNEFDSTKWKDFPEQLLSQVTMQRKQRIKIVATSQVFTRVVKQLREQCYEVVECRTLFGRWTFTKCYDAIDYNAVIDFPDKKRKLFKLWKYSFIQSDYLRDRYDSYQIIEKLKTIELLPRTERVI
jgi:hypothetical protein